MGSFKTDPHLAPHTVRIQCTVPNVDAILFHLLPLVRSRILPALLFWFICYYSLWRRGVTVITTAQLHSTKPELRFCAGSNPACSVSEIRDGEDLWQWSRLEIRLNAFRRSTIIIYTNVEFLLVLLFYQWVSLLDNFSQWNQNILSAQARILLPVRMLPNRSKA